MAGKLTDLTPIALPLAGSLMEVSSKVSSTYTSRSILLENVIAASLSAASNSITVVGAGTDIDLLIKPKGNGAVVVGAGGWVYATQASGAGSIILNNGTSDTPNLKFAYGNNHNIGMDVNAGTMRWISDSDEAGGAVIATMGLTGHIAAGNYASNSGFITSTGSAELIMRASSDLGSVGIGVHLQYSDQSAWRDAVAVSNASGFSTLFLMTLGGKVSVGVTADKVGGVIFNSYTDTATTSTNGTEDDLYSYTTVANTFTNNGDSVAEVEHVQFVSSATASRRLKKYFAGTLIFDSGSLTLTLGGDFDLETTVIRESSTVVRCTVQVVTTSASSVPYSTYTRITGLTLTGTNILKTTGIASGTGAASGDIVNKMAKVWHWPAA